MSKKHRPPANNARPLPFGTPPRPNAPPEDERGEPKRTNKVAAFIAILLLAAFISGPFLVFFN